MNAAELKARLLRVVSVESPGSAPAHLVDSVVHAVNGAYQVMWQDVPKDRRATYTRRTRSETIAPGQSMVELPRDTQSVLPPVRRLPTLTPLHPARHRSEVENYGIYAGAVSGDAPGGAPQVYYLDAFHAADADSVRIRLLVAPTPVEEVELRLVEELEAPAIDANDLCSASPAALKIPHQYVETLLYPVAAYLLATQSRWFKAAEALPGIEAEYQRALGRLGVVDPSVAAAAANVRPQDR
jgi:hypothetical protein